MFADKAEKKQKSGGFWWKTGQRHQCYHGVSDYNVTQNPDLFFLKNKI